MCKIQMCVDLTHVYLYSFVIWQGMCCICCLYCPVNAKCNKNIMGKKIKIVKRFSVYQNRLKCVVHSCVSKFPNQYLLLQNISGKQITLRDIK